MLCCKLLQCFLRKIEWWTSPPRGQEENYSLINTEDEHFTGVLVLTTLGKYLASDDAVSCAGNGLSAKYSCHAMRIFRRLCDISICSGGVPILLTAPCFWNMMMMKSSCSVLIFGHVRMREESHFIPGMFKDPKKKSIVR